MVLLNMTAEPIKKKEFSGYTPGEYLAQVQALVSGESKKGLLCWEVVFRGPGFGVIKLRMYDTAFGRQDLYRLLTAIGIDPDRKDIETDEIVDRFVTIKIEEGEPYNDKPTWNVTDIFEASSDDSEEDVVVEDDEDDWS